MSLKLHLKRVLFDMQKIVKSDICFVRLMKCGSCDNNMKHIRKDAESELRNFPANVVLIKHKQGYVLFDTGYTRRIYNCGIIGKIYNRLNPTHCNREDEAITQLSGFGISANEINTIILSHLHPDHIAGLLDFPKAKFVTSSSCISLYHHANVKDLVFKQLIPDDFANRAVAMENSLPKCDNNDIGSCYDVFSDGEVLLKKVSGHAFGQTIMYLPKLKMLFAADMCWGMDLIEYIPHMKKIARLVQHDYEQYNKSALELLKLQQRGITVYPSHQAFEEEILYKNE